LPTYSSVPVPLRDLPWTRRALFRGAAVFREGDRAGLVYILDAGLVKLSRDVDSHRKTIVRLVRPGEMIGAGTLSAATHERYTAESLADGGVWEAPREQFHALCARSVDAMTWVAQQVEQCLVEVERRIQFITFDRVETRLLKLLCELGETSTMAEHQLSAGTVIIPLSQSEVAQMIGATRETASTTLNQLERRGLLRLSRRQIEVASVEALRAAATGGDRANRAHE